MVENNDLESVSLRRAFSWKEMDECCQYVLSDIVTVELIGRLQSKTRAADLLGMTLPAIRSRLAPLERILKGAVTERGKNGALTPLGLEIRKLWENIHGPLEHFILGVERLRDERTLTLGIPQSVWESEGDWLTAAYESFAPGCAIKPIFAEGFHTIETRVRHGVFDIGVVSFPPLKRKIAPPVVLRCWCNEAMVLVVGCERSAQFMSLSRATPDDLRGLHSTFITMPENSGTYNAVSEYLRKLSIRFKYYVPAKDESEALDAVIADKGISILPLSWVQKMTDGLNVNDFRLSPALARPLAFLYRENGLKQKCVNAFVKCVEQRPK